MNINVKLSEVLKTLDELKSMVKEHAGKYEAEYVRGYNDALADMGKKILYDE